MAIEGSRGLFALDLLDPPAERVKASQLARVLLGVLPHRNLVKPRAGGHGGVPEGHSHGGTAGHDHVDHRKIPRPRRQVGATVTVVPPEQVRRVPSRLTHWGSA